MKYYKKIYSSSFEALEKKNREERTLSNKQNIKVPVTTLKEMSTLGISTKKG